MNNQMEQIIKTEDNKTEYYLNDRLLLTITDLGNDYYIIENSVGRLEGYCKTLDENRTECRLDCPDRTLAILIVS